MKPLSFEEKPTEGELILEGKITWKVKKRQLPSSVAASVSCSKTSGSCPTASAHENVAFVR